MTILVISDTHGRKNRISDVLLLHKKYDALLFLGDGLRDFEYIQDDLCGFAAVKGNCDGFSFFSAEESAPTERMLCLDGVKILMMHGHSHSVKSGTDRAAAYALARGADVLLYGHTHIAENTYYPIGSNIGGAVTERPLYVFNPGSLGEPRYGAPSYGVLEIRNGSVLLSHGNI